MDKKKWIPRDLKKGSFTAQAKRAGMGVQEYAGKVTKKGSGASVRTKQRANLAKIFAQIVKKKRS